MNIEEYSYISSVDYIDQLEFAYVEVFSLQRGEAYETQLMTRQNEYKKLDLLQAKNEISPEQEKWYKELKHLVAETQYLWNTNGELHPSAVRTHIFGADDPKVSILKEILKTEVKTVPEWMCVPVYRDAVVFYNQQGHLVSTLNICLSCEYMQTAPLSYVNADKQAYELFRQFFMDLGHPVES